MTVLGTRKSSNASWGKIPLACQTKGLVLVKGNHYNENIYSFGKKKRALTRKGSGDKNHRARARIWTSEGSAKRIVLILGDEEGKVRVLWYRRTLLDFTTKWKCAESGGGIPSILGNVMGVRRFCKS